MYTSVPRERKMNERSWDAVERSLTRSAETLRKIATKRELPTDYSQNLARFAAFLERQLKRGLQQGDLDKAALFRQGARLKVQIARQSLRAKRLGLDVKSFWEPSTWVDDTISYVLTGLKPRRWRRLR